MSRQGEASALKRDGFADRQGLLPISHLAVQRTVWYLLCVGTGAQTHRLVEASRILARDAGKLRFTPPVRYVYNPLIYARAPHESYLTRFADAPKRVVFVGMNPGPWGMAQTGVPFGEVSAVRDWLRLSFTAWAATLWTVSFSAI